MYRLEGKHCRFMVWSCSYAEMQIYVHCTRWMFRRCHRLRGKASGCWRVDACRFWERQKRETTGLLTKRSTNDWGDRDADLPIHPARLLANMQRRTVHKHVFQVPLSAAVRVARKSYSFVVLKSGALIAKVILQILAFAITSRLSRGRAFVR